MEHLFRTTVLNHITLKTVLVVVVTMMMEKKKNIRMMTIYGER